MPAPGSPGFARAVLERADDLYRGQQSHGIMQMDVKTRHWERSMSLEAWSEGRDYSLVRILEPKKIAGPRRSRTTTTCSPTSTTPGAPSRSRAR